MYYIKLLNLPYQKEPFYILKSYQTELLYTDIQQHLHIGLRTNNPPESEYSVQANQSVYVYPENLKQQTVLHLILACEEKGAHKFMKK